MGFFVFSFFHLQFLHHFSPNYSSYTIFFFESAFSLSLLTHLGLFSVSSSLFYKPPPSHPVLSISAGSSPALSAQGAAEGLQPDGETGGQRLPDPHRSVLFYSHAGHGCGTNGTDAP